MLVVLARMRLTIATFDLMEWIFQRSASVLTAVFRDVVEFLLFQKKNYERMCQTSANKVGALLARQNGPWKWTINSIDCLIRKRLTEFDRNIFTS
jgi:hypothetical protein